MSRTNLSPGDRDRNMMIARRSSAACRGTYNNFAWLQSCRCRHRSLNNNQGEPEMEPPHTRGVEVYALGVKAWLWYHKDTFFACRRDWCLFRVQVCTPWFWRRLFWFCLSVCVFLSWCVRSYRSLSAYRSLSCTMPSTEVERREGRGRCLIAAKDFGLGDLVSAP